MIDTNVKMNNKMGIIIALDGMKKKDAIELAKKLSSASQIVCFKANDLLDDEGGKIIEELSQYGLVMADPKYHDIPNTVGNRVKKISSYHPMFITVHASGGIEMMRAAVENTSEITVAIKSKILAVTVLTSLDEEECNLNLGGPVKAKVLQFARNAILSGVEGIVCSANELAFLSKFPELKWLIKVTPGIRPKWHIDPSDDQARIVTPADAVKLGADFIVIGRPIVRAKDPLKALEDTISEIEEAERELAEKRRG